MSRCGRAWKATRCSQSLRRSDTRNQTAASTRQTAETRRQKSGGRRQAANSPRQEPISRDQEPIRTERADVSIYDLRLTIYQESYAKTKNTQRRREAFSLDCYRQD